GAAYGHRIVRTRVAAADVGPDRGQVLADLQLPNEWPEGGKVGRLEHGALALPARQRLRVGEELLESRKGCLTPHPEAPGHVVAEVRRACQMALEERQGKCPSDRWVPVQPFADPVPGYEALDEHLLCGFHARQYPTAPRAAPRLYMIWARRHSVRARRRCRSDAQLLARSSELPPAQD